MRPFFLPNPAVAPPTMVSSTLSTDFGVWNPAKVRGIEAKWFRLWGKESKDLAAEEQGMLVKKRNLDEAI